MGIGQSIEDYENWRDRQYDREPPEPQPDEHYSLKFTHDYTDDTQLDITRYGEDFQLRLSFQSEDPDMGTEELEYNGNGSLGSVVHDLLDEIRNYLDAKQNYYREDPEVIHSINDYYDDFSSTALYAFESALKGIEREETIGIQWKPIEPEKKEWLYSNHGEKDVLRGCIGHLRGDFGRDGDEFWTSWFDHQPALKRLAFRDELQNVVNGMREEGGLLHDFASMSKGCRQGTSIDDSYGFRMETRNYEYCLRCIPRRGDYNFYLYCYDKNAQREHAQEKPSVTAQLKQQPKPEIKSNNKNKEMEI